MSKFNPFIFSSTENAAFNAAHVTWTAAELITHYVLLPLVPITLKAMYEGGKLCFGHRAPAPVQNPPQNQGWMSWAWNKAKSVATTATKWFVVPEGVSYIIHQAFAKRAWDGLRLYATSFMRPIYEKILPGIFAFWDKNDINASLRDMAPETGFAKYLYPIRGFFTHMFSSQDDLDAQVFAKKYFEYGQAVTDYLSKDIDMFGRALNGIYESPRCLTDAQVAKQCANDAYNFMGEVVENSPILSTIRSTIGGSFASWANALKDGLFHYPGQAFKLADAALWGIAQGVHSQVPVIPAHAFYYGEYLLSAYLTYKFSRVAGSLAFAKVHQLVLGGAGVNQINNMNIALQRAQAGQQGPAAIQQAGPNGAGAVAPQQQMMLQQFINAGAAPNGANLGLQGDGAPGANVPPQQPPVDGAVPANNVAPQAPLDGAQAAQQLPVGGVAPVDGEARNAQGPGI